MPDFTAPRGLPTVLLIDDDMMTREVMATILSMSGYLLHTADGGAQALAMLAGNTCAPAVILMDVQMPGISGLDLMAQLRARSSARLYVISGSHPSQQVKAAADGFLLKPFAPEALNRLIDQQEARSHPRAQHPDPAETIIHPETLAQLRSMMPEPAVRQIFETIIADLGSRATALEAATARGDWAEACRIGHAIKGGGSMAGALQVARIGEQIESGALEQAAVNQTDNSSGILADLRAAALNLQRILDVEIKDQA